ncbi:MAG: 50S ribosomal protein L16 [Candidatus Aenigmarchaeota archaeon]|nr:50S ribosomal protein L16 [Candidatus Aenigmarchaeota archaeon]
MGLRPARSERKLERPWTRYATKKTKSYIPTLPTPKIHQFNMGEQNDGYDVVLDLVAREPAQVRDNALEASRIVAQKFLEMKLAKSYFFKVLLYPHQIIREKPIAQGAGADRYSRGMKLAFGKPVRRAVQIKRGQTLFRLQTFKANLEVAKQALKKSSLKLTTPTQVIIKE